MTTELLEQVKRIKADEFYTQLLDIEAEIRHFKDQFKGKIILY